ncbi:hypothetical protein AV530_004788 [Patagioenas fasciata monilis]|uniref:Uncharacterized protein n=1 Tax=Patagioenas fasciata monilis TaxID=372326 RepID=A0A1V4KE72_PATFA|nr:hypothetical protein AV530_004788 [Patagioenas fasciata monilis]
MANPSGSSPQQRLHKTQIWAAALAKLETKRNPCVFFTGGVPHVLQLSLGRVPAAGVPPADAAGARTKTQARLY